MIVAVLWVVMTGAPALEPAWECSKTKPCRVESRQAAGKDADGVALWVVHLIRGKVVPETERTAGACTSEEYWVVRASSPPQTQCLVRLCNDGYGASGVGEDSITVKPNRFIHAQYGGSAWRWSNETHLQLWPPRLLEETSRSFHTSAPDLVSERSWKWTSFAGTATRPLAPCDADGAPVVDEEKTPPTHESVLIPQVELQMDEWPQLDLTRCAAKASKTIHGKPGSDDDAALWVVAADDETLLLEVHDDQLISNPEKWIFGDHLELWLGETSLTPADACRGKSGPKALQWGIDLPSGTVHAGLGKSEPPTVQVERVHSAQHGQVLRVRLTLPEGGWLGLAVVYADSDDGKTQERLLATSDLSYGQAGTLGERFRIGPRQATCVVEQGALVPRQPSPSTPSQALVSTDEE